MKLNPKSPLIRWAYLFEHQGAWMPQTDVCRLFWRVVLLTPIKLAAVVGLAGIVGWTVARAIDDPFGFFGFLLMAVLFASVIAALLGLGTAAETGLRAAYTAAKKRNWCPSVEWTEEADQEPSS